MVSSLQVYSKLFKLLETDAQVDYTIATKYRKHGCQKSPWSPAKGIWNCNSIPI